MKIFKSLKSPSWFSKVSRTTRPLATLALIGCLGSPAFANPSGPTVRHGQVNITPGALTQIQQLTDRAIVDWNSFSIGLNEAVRILQPSQMSVILNRVTGQDASQILGQLSANGNVFLINPNGILFGPSSTVNVGGLVASTLNITDQDFLAGNYSFYQDEGKDLAAVVNQGQITISEGGFAVLTGPAVINEGSILARAGRVVLASGEQATLDLEGRDLVHFALGGQVSDGVVVLAPGMMSDTLAQVFGVETSRRADSLVQMPDGSVRMINSSGTTVQAGQISVDGRAGLDAGKVLLDSTDLTLLSAGSITSASGQGIDSDAGEILALSSMAGGTAVFDSAATLAAAGGQTGDGGFIEVSANVVDVRGQVDLSARAGQAGSFLLDPTDLFVVDESFVPPVSTTRSYVTDEFIEGILDANGSVIVESDGGRIVFDVTATSNGIDTGIQSTQAGTLTFRTLVAAPGEPGTSIELNVDQIDIGGQLVLRSATDIDFGSGSIVADDGLTATADGEILGNGFFIDTRNRSGATNSQGNSVLLTAGSNVDLSNATIYYDTEGGGADNETLRITADNGSINITNSLLQSDDTVASGGVTYFSDTIMRAVNGNIGLSETTVRAKDIQLTAGGQISLNNSPNTTILASNGFSASAASFDADTIQAGTSISVTAPMIELDGASLSAGRLIRLDASSSGSGEVHINNAALTTSQSPGAGFTPTITIVAQDLIDGDATATRGLHAARIILETFSATSPGIEVAIDTTADDASSVPTQLTALSAGDVLIRDLSTADTQGLDLVRGVGDAAVRSTNGDVSITTKGKIGLGDGNYDDGDALVRAGGAVNLTADRILDQNSTSTAKGVRPEIEGASVALTTVNGVGTFGLNQDIDVQTPALTVVVEAAGAPINVGAQTPLDFVDVELNGGPMRIADSSGAALVNLPVGGSGPNVLQLDQSGSQFNPVAVRVTSLADLLVDNVDVRAGQTLVLATQGAAILSGDTGGVAPNIDAADGSVLVLASSDGIGTLDDFLSVRTSELGIQASSSVYLDLQAAGTGPVVLHGNDEQDLDLTASITNFPLSPNYGGIEVTGDMILDVAGSLQVQGGVSAQNIAIDASQALDLQSGLSATESLLLSADSLSGGNGQIFATSVGLDFAQGVGTAGSPLEISGARNLVIGNNSSASYYLLTNTELGQDITWVSSVEVADRFVSGNRANTLQHANLGGDITASGNLRTQSLLLDATDDTDAFDINVGAEIVGDGRAALLAGGSINQSTAGGVVESELVVLDAGENIGTISNDLRTRAERMAVRADQSAFIRNLGPLILVDDGSLTGPVGAAQDFRVINGFDSLEVATPLTAGNIALITGSDLSFPAQTIPLTPTIVVNADITATNNAVLISQADIVKGNNALITATNLGLGAVGSVGTQADPLSINTNGLTVSADSSFLSPTGTPTPQTSVTAVGATVTSQSVDPPDPPGPPDPPTPPPAPNEVVVEVVLNPVAQSALESEEFLNGEPFAANNVEMVEDFLGTLDDTVDVFEPLLDPEGLPAGWWNDEMFLQKKFRQKDR